MNFISHSISREYFEQYGKLKSVVIMHKTKCAFVNFATRASAEIAAERIEDAGLKIKERWLRATWGKPRPQGPKAAEAKQADGNVENMQKIQNCARN